MYMTWWNKELLKRLEELGIDQILYKRYVIADIVIAVKKIIEESRQGE